MQAYPIDLFGDTFVNRKTCVICKTTKTIDNFRWRKMATKNRPTRRPQYDSICVECRRAKCRAYNRSAKGAITRKKRKCKGYGITVAEHDKMYSDQNGSCAICGTSELPLDPRTGRPYELAVDHCHKTGKVRSLLCHFCNVGLGAYKDSPELLLRAIGYLRRHGVE